MNCYSFENSKPHLEASKKFTSREDMLDELIGSLRKREFDTINVFDHEGTCIINVKDGLL